MRGACPGVKMEGVKIGIVKTGCVRIGARRAWPDRHRSYGQHCPRTLRPVQVLVLSVIAGMAHSTLKSGAATRNSVAFGASTEGPAATGARPFGRRTLKSSHRLTRQRMWLITLAIRCEWINGRIRNDNGRACPTRQNQELRTFSDSFLSGVGGHGKTQLPIRRPSGSPCKR